MGEILRDVGPADVDSAGDMVAKVGVHNQAKRLIAAVRDNYPREMVAALSRPEDQGRTKKLVEDEVEELVGEAGWDDLEEIEGARVHGTGKAAVVGIVFRTESGRSARGVIPYSEFERSVAAYDAAIAEGGVVLTDEEDPKQLRRALEAAQKQLAEAQEAKEAPAPDAEPTEPTEPFEGYSEAKAKEIIEKVESGDLSLSELLALKQAEEDGEGRSTVLKAVDEKLDAAEAALKPADE